MQIIIVKVRSTLRKRIGVYEKALYCSAGMAAEEQLSEFRYFREMKINCALLPSPIILIMSLFTASLRSLLISKLLRFNRLDPASVLSKSVHRVTRQWWVAGEG